MSKLIKHDGKKCIEFDFDLDICKKYEVDKSNIKELNKAPGDIEANEDNKYDLQEGDWIIEGYAATSDVDRQDDIITPAALKEAVQQILDDARTVLRNHDLDDEIGVITDAKYKRDDKALWVQLRISKTRPDIWAKVNEGVLNRFSIRAQILDYEFIFDEETQMHVMNINSIKMIEVSLVSVPANPNAKVLAHFIKKAVGEYLKNAGMGDQKFYIKIYNNNEGEEDMDKAALSKNMPEGMENVVVEYVDSTKRGKANAKKAAEKAATEKAEKEEATKKVDTEKEAKKEVKDETKKEVKKEETKKECTSDDKCKDDCKKDETSKDAEVKEQASEDKKEDKVETKKAEEGEKKEEVQKKEVEKSEKDSKEETKKEVEKKVDSKEEVKEEVTAPTKEETLKGLEATLNSTKNEDLRKTLEVAIEAMKEEVRKDQEAKENEKNSPVTVEMHTELLEKVEEIGKALSATITALTQIVKSNSEKLEKVVETIKIFTEKAENIEQIEDTAKTLKDETLEALKSFETSLAESKNLDGQEGDEETKEVNKKYKFTGILNKTRG